MKAVVALPANAFSIDHTTSVAVSSLPRLLFTPWRRLKRQIFPSLEVSQLSASAGRTVAVSPPSASAARASAFVRGHVKLTRLS